MIVCDLLQTNFYLKSYLFYMEDFFEFQTLIFAKSRNFVDIPALARGESGKRLRTNSYSS